MHETRFLSTEIESAEAISQRVSFLFGECKAVFRPFEVRAEGPGVGPALREARRGAHGAHEGAEQDHFPRGPGTEERA